MHLGEGASTTALNCYGVFYKIFSPSPPPQIFQLLLRSCPAWDDGPRCSVGRDLPAMCRPSASSARERTGIRRALRGTLRGVSPAESLSICCKQPGRLQFPGRSSGPIRCAAPRVPCSGFVLVEISTKCCSCLQITDSWTGFCVVLLLSALLLLRWLGTDLPRRAGNFDAEADIL